MLHIRPSCDPAETISSSRLQIGPLTHATRRRRGPRGRQGTFRFETWLPHTESTARLRSWRSEVVVAGSRRRLKRAPRGRSSGCYICTSTGPRITALRQWHGRCALWRCGRGHAETSGRFRNIGVCGSGNPERTKERDLMNFIARLRALLRGTSGQDLLEYALLVALIALVCVAVITSTGTNVQNIFTRISSALQTAGAPAP